MSLGQEPQNSPIPLPLSSHAKPVDSFAQALELERELEREVRGEVRFDSGSRAMYATDGSNYRQVPIGLVIPRDADDVGASIAACNEFGAPILARGDHPAPAREPSARGHLLADRLTEPKG